MSYYDHRSSALPLVEALEALGDLAETRVLQPPTFPALRAALEEAEQQDRSFHVVHFDGHGVFDRTIGLGGLCFEDPRDAELVGKRRAQTVDAQKMADLLRERRIPLVFLDACRTAQVEEDPTTSVAGSNSEFG